jgi:alkylation response protein AidB-like acyl-CoA dehydrogenase
MGPEDAVRPSFAQWHAPSRHPSERWQHEAVPEDPIAVARRVAEEVLLPDAAAVDATDTIPDAHLAALDASGLTGLAAHEPDLRTRAGVTAALASGCLATAFIWLQHQGALAAVLRSPLAERYGPGLTSGAVRSGVAITALRGPAPLTATRTDDGWRLTGRVPWVTGWQRIDVVRVAALDGDTVVSVLLDARESPTLIAEPLALTAARASGTATIRFDRHPAPADRLISTVPHADWLAGDAAGLAGNGALALGVAARAAAAAGSGALAAEVEAALETLATASVDEIPAARAACSALAVRAAAAAAVVEGARSVLAGSTAARLTREAQFLLVFGSRPAIREELLTGFGA